MMQLPCCRWMLVLVLASLSLAACSTTPVPVPDYFESEIEDRTFNGDPVRQLRFRMVFRVGEDGRGEEAQFMEVLAAHYLETGFRAFEMITRDRVLVRDSSWDIDGRLVKQGRNPAPKFVFGRWSASMPRSDSREGRLYLYSSSMEWKTSPPWWWGSGDETEPTAPWWGGVEQAEPTAPWWGEEAK